MTQTKQRQYVQMICEAGLMLALAIVLNNLKLYRLPNGGSISLEMLPVFLFAIRWGAPWGMLLGFALGTVSLFLDGAVAWGWQSLILDYLLAFTPLGLCGLFKGKRLGIFFGSVLGAFCRFLVHFYSGVTIYAILAPTELFNMTFTSPWMYSLVYNGSYMLLDTVLCMVIIGLMYKPMRRFFEV